MDPVARALWFIEGNFTREIALEDIAEAAGVSRFHLTRAFGQSLGRSVIRYLRSRRLSEAANALAQGATDILSVALESGYGSHEAFTRAFRDEFGITPESFRANPEHSSIQLTEAFLMNTEAKIKLADPRIVEAKATLFAGIGRRYEYDAMGAIPAQWQQFNQHAGSISNEIRGAAYGICANSDATGLDYICAVEVRDFSDVDKDFVRMRIPAQRYAVFAHPGHISEIRAVWQAIWRNWLPDSGRQVADAASLERYGSSFDPDTGKGGYEIWVPLKS